MGTAEQEKEAKQKKEKDLTSQVCLVGLVYIAAIIGLLGFAYWQFNKDHSWGYEMARQMNERHKHDEL